MSGVKEPALMEFTRLLRGRGVSLSELARRARVGRAALSQVLNGARCGRHTWKHVLPLLTPAELSQLKQCSAWNIHAEVAEAELAGEAARSAVTNT